jgi:TorA maturation chaperone TorD
MPEGHRCQWGERVIETRVSPPVDDRTAGSEDGLRSHIYGLLARLMADPPDAETLELLALVEARPSHEDDLGRAWAGLQTAAAEATPEALADEYHALFVGLGRGELVPYGCWYLTGYLMERPLAILRTDLARLGFERSAEVKEPEDHAAIICDVMSALTAEDGGFDLPTRADFFRRHVGPWLGRFFKDMTEADSARFYRAVGQFGRLFAELEADYYGDKPAVSALTREAVLRPTPANGVTGKAQ